MHTLIRLRAPLVTLVAALALSWLGIASASPTHVAAHQATSHSGWLSVPLASEGGPPPGHRALLTLEGGPPPGH